MDFPDSALNGILNNGNAYESQILMDYLTGKSLSIKDVLDSCCDKLDTGGYSCRDSRTSRMSSTTRTCYQCGLKNFKDLAYHYRRDIPADDLPGERYLHMSVHVNGSFICPAISHISQSRCPVHKNKSQITWLVGVKRPLVCSVGKMCVLSVVVCICHGATRF